MNILNLLIEQADPTGTYVGANIEAFNKSHKELLKSIDKLKGVIPKLHTTVIYSKQYIEPSILEDTIKSYKIPIQAKIIGADSFDALPDKNGKRAEEVSTLVLKLECKELIELHSKLKKLGCTHIYPQLSPHISLYYGVPIADCKEAVKILKAYISKLEEPLYVNLTKIFVEPIVEDWGKKNTKA